MGNSAVGTGSPSNTSSTLGFGGNIVNPQLNFDRETYMFQNTAVNIDMFWRGPINPTLPSSGSITHDLHLEGQCNYFDEITDYWMRFSPSARMTITGWADHANVDDTSDDATGVGGPLGPAYSDLFFPAANSPNVVNPTGPNSIAVNGLCSNGQCIGKCGRSFKKAWPLDEPQWTTIWLDVIGEEVKGLWINRNLDGNIGSPMDSEARGL